mmetsp:Transcript_59074/g.110698  ORF Transcript_59074/g.110698 Transcript_59074/m.110698 type:complete len:215 (+) Transcript_59074:36-680(+)
MANIKDWHGVETLRVCSCLHKGCTMRRRSSLEGNAWRTSPLTAPCEEPWTCCLSCFCPGCVAFRQRHEILQLSGEEYICFGGLFADWGCCLCGRCGRCCPALEKPFHWPTSGLLVEAFMCTPLAIVGNRFLIQDEFGRAHDEWDDCICCCFAAAQMAQHADELRLVQRQHDVQAFGRLRHPHQHAVMYGAASPDQKDMQGGASTFPALECRLQR